MLPATGALNVLPPPNNCVLSCAGDPNGPPPKAAFLDLSAKNRIIKSSHKMLYLKSQLCRTRADFVRK